MIVLNRVLVMLVLLGALGLLTNCGSTWDGLKSDTSVNMQKSGKAISSAGEKISSD